MALQDEVKTFKKTLRVDESTTALNFLHAHTPLSKVKIKDAMTKGAVLLKRTRQGRRRLRRATFSLHRGDELSICYSSDILQIQVPKPTLIFNGKGYSIWHKPPGLLTQGTDYGDHCSLLRQAELLLHLPEAPRLVHRLDRDAAGLVLLAHLHNTAAKFSELFRKREITKTYLAIVNGKPGEVQSKFEFTSPIEGKEAKTVATVSQVLDTETVLTVDLCSGRKHQIRRHLSEAGHPLIGDRLYGDGSARRPLQLFAIALSFVCPVSGDKKTIQLPKEILQELCPIFTTTLAGEDIKLSQSKL